MCNISTYISLTYVSVYISMYMPVSLCLHLSLCFSICFSILSLYPYLYSISLYLFYLYVSPSIYIFLSLNDLLHALTPLLTFSLSPILTFWGSNGSGCKTSGCAPTSLSRSVAVNFFVTCYTTSTYSWFTSFAYSTYSVSHVFTYYLYSTILSLSLIMKKHFLLLNSDKEIEK